MPKVPGDARGRRSHQSGHQKAVSNYNRANGKSNGCCYAAQAVKAVWAGKFRLAKRYAVLDVKARWAGVY